MIQGLWQKRSWRARYLIAGTAVAAAIAVSGVALATHFTYEHKASIYRGSGSDTTYELMTNLNKLYNQSVGCKSIHPDKAQQTLDLKCQAEDANDITKENYDHDVFLEHYPIGSSFGISQLNQQGLAGIPIVDYARSSRKPKVGDSTNMRFIGFARDALSWACFKSTAGSGCSGMPVDAGGRPTLTQAQLRSIYKCEVTNWSQVGGANVPIKVYQAQSGSGTRATWDEFMTFVPTDACATPVFENNSKLVATADREEAIMYYSYGRYNQQDPPGFGTTLGRID
ncbi:MAG: substrate-binding domain-containing protein, partial [Actinomycetota bacterium]